jgi:hypothetical protein
MQQTAYIHEQETKDIPSRRKGSPMEDGTMAHRSRTFSLVFEVLLVRWVLFESRSLWVYSWVGGDEKMYGCSSVGEVERKSGTKYSATTTTRVDSTLL